MDSNTPLLQVTRTETEPCCISLQIEVPAEQVQKTYRQAVAKVRSRAKLPGFRPGKTPEARIIKLFGREIDAEAREKLVQESFSQVITEQDLKLAAEAKLGDGDKAEIILGQPFTFTINCELEPTFTLPEYKNLQLTRPECVVTDDDIEKFIDVICQERTQMKESDTAAQEGDLLKAKFEATLPEGFEITEKTEYLLKSEGNWMALRDPELLPGIKEKLVGAEKNKEIQVEISFPEDFHTVELAGQTFPYTFTVEEIMRLTKPEFNDELAQQMNFESADAVRQAVKTHLLNNKEQEIENQLRQDALAAIMKDLDFPVPPTIFKQHRAVVTRNFEREAQESGMPKEKISEQLQEQREKLDNATRSQIMTTYVLGAIAAKEDVKVSQNSVLNELAGIAEKRGESFRKTLKTMLGDGSVQKLAQNMTTQTTINKIIDWAIITTATPEENSGDSQQDEAPAAANETETPTEEANKEINPEANAESGTEPSGSEAQA